MQMQKIHRKKFWLLNKKDCLSGSFSYTEKVYTEIISTTIEDLANRKSLLKLEGGEDAFKKRARKLLSGFVS